MKRRTLVTGAAGLLTAGVLGKTGADLLRGRNEAIAQAGLELERRVLDEGILVNLGDMVPDGPVRRLVLPRFVITGEPQQRYLDYGPGMQTLEAARVEGVGANLDAQLDGINITAAKGMFRVAIASINQGESVGVEIYRREGADANAAFALALGEHASRRDVVIAMPVPQPSAAPQG